jgi:hypothetical protein
VQFAVEAKSHSGAKQLPGAQDLTLAQAAAVLFYELLVKWNCWKQLVEGKLLLGVLSQWSWRKGSNLSFSSCCSILVRLIGVIHLLILCECILFSSGFSFS